MKITLNKTIKIALSAVIFLASLPAVSAIPYRNAFEQYEIINAQTKELNLSLLAKIQFMVEQNQFSMAAYVPLKGLPQNDDGQVIGRRILKHTVQNWLDNSDFSEVGAVGTPSWIRQASSVNDSMVSSVERDGHKLSFRVRPVETQAEVTYTGVVKAVLAYDIGHDEASVVVSKVAGEQTYSFQHIDNSTEIRDTLVVSWNF